MGIYFHHHPVNFAHIIKLWARGQEFSFPAFSHDSFIYAFIYVSVLFVFTTSCLVLSLVLIYKFIKQAEMDKNG